MLRCAPLATDSVLTRLLFDPYLCGCGTFFFVFTQIKVLVVCLMLDAVAAQRTICDARRFRDELTRVCAFQRRDLRYMPIPSQCIPIFLFDDDLTLFRFLMFFGCFLTIAVQFEPFKLVMLGRSFL